MIPSRNGGLVATKDLSVPEVAARLKIKVDEVLILILAGVLSAESKGTDTFQIREDSLEEFALLIALNLEEDETFEDGLGLFINSVRQALSCAETPVPVLTNKSKKSRKNGRAKRGQKALGRKLGWILVSQGFASKEEVKAALKTQKKSGEKRRLGEILVENKDCGVEEVAKALALQCGKKYCDLARLEIDEALIDLVAKEVAIQHTMVPVSKGPQHLIVASSVALDFMVLEDLKFLLGFELDYVIASKDAINDAISKYYGEFELEDQFTEMTGMDIQFGSSASDDFYCDADKYTASTDRSPPEPKPAAEETPKTRGVSFKRNFAKIKKPPAPAPKPVVQELKLDDLEDLRRDLSGVVEASDQGRFRVTEKQVAPPESKVADGDFDFTEEEKERSISELVFDAPEETETEQGRALIDWDDEEDGANTERCSISESVGFDDADAKLVEVGSDDFSSSGFGSDSAIDIASPDDSGEMETEAFELMEESGETDGFVAEVRTNSRSRQRASKRKETGFLKSLLRSQNDEAAQDGLYAMDLPETISQQDSESIVHRITTKKIMPAEDAPSTGAFRGSLFGAKSALQINESNRQRPELTKGKADKKSKRRDRAPAKPKPMSSPAPDMNKNSASATPRTKQIEIETVERRTTVRHHKQMYLQKSYPLFVIISQHKIKKLISVLVDQVTSKKAFNIKKSNPIVHIRPIFPGCLCVPNELDLDVTERVAEAQFWLTPQALGTLEGAKVEILYEGKVVDSIDINCAATTQALAKLSGSAAFITTSFGPTFDALGKSLSEKGAGWIGDLLQMAGSENGPMITSALLGVMTVLFYLWKKPREADPIQNMFDYEMDSAPRGNPHVMKQKCRLVLLSRAGRQKFELVEEKTTMGRTADCLVTLKERSVSPKHAEINFDPDLQEFSVRPLDGSVKVNGIEVGKVQKLPRDAVIEFGGDVSFWFYDEREDASGWDRSHIRAKIEQKLMETLGSFSAEIQGAFRDPKNKTARAALATLMVKGVLTPKRWSLIKKASDGFRS